MVRTFRPPCFNDWHSCPITHILPLILDMEMRNNEHMISPSNFVKEMKLTTEQRYERLIHPSSKANCIFASLKTFKVIPGILVYQNYERGSTYSLKLNVINIQDVSKSIQVQMEESTYFSLHFTETYGTKVAPGLKFTVEVRFSTDVLMDYKHKITFITADETFEVPILAIGPRPLLDLPDRIVIPRTAIRLTTERTIVVQNISSIWANFTLEAGNGFAVHRAREALKPDECCRVTVFFYAEEIGRIGGILKFGYETGEVLFVELEVMVEEADLRLAPTKLGFIDCPLGLSEEKTVTLFNDSDYIVDYRWISHDCPQCTREARSAIKERFADVMEYQLVRDNKLVYHNIVDHVENQHIYERILDEHRKECDMSKEPSFLDSNFIIAPSSGQLWPKTKNNFSIIYAPKTVDLHNSIAYLDITGRSRPSSVDMFGNCKGPTIQMNLEELDAQSIYIGSVHRYEVVFKNPGPVPGNVRFKKTKSKFGGEITCSEDTFMLSPEDVKFVYIEFTSLTRGRFIEVVTFVIVESQQVLSFNMTGTIVSPLLNFNITNVDFGDLSVGETQRSDFMLENNTQVKIEYQVAIVGSNSESSLLSMASDDFSEFVCSSTSGVVEPYTKIPFYVDVTPSEAIDKDAELAIYMWEARQHSRTVYITYRSRVPILADTVPNITIKSMFITQSYYRSLSIQNKSEYMGNLTVTAVVDNTYLQISIDQPEVFINSWGTYELRVELRADVIGDMHGKIIGQFRGARQTINICDISVASRGPCIDFTLVDTNFGTLDTLTPIFKTFTMANDSPIPATVFISIVGPYITALDPVILIGPEQSVESSLRIYGTVAGRFKTTIKLEIEGADSDSVVFSGEFVGGSISVLPHLEPICDIGAVSTLNACQFEVTFYNEGKMAHLITIKEYETLVNYLSNTSPPNPERPFYIWDRLQLIIQPGKMETAVINCFSKHPCSVSTRFVVNAKKLSRRNMITLKIFDFKLLSCFEVPHVTLSKPSMEFRIDIGTSQTTSVLTDDVTLINQSNVPLNMELQIDEPFYIVDSSGLVNRQLVTLDSSMDVTLTIEFKPDLSDQKCHVKKSAMRIMYLSHPAMDKLFLMGGVNYPSVSFEPNVVDFGCIPIGHTNTRMVYLVNTSPLIVEYTLSINQDNIIINSVESNAKEIEITSEVGSYDSMDYMLSSEFNPLPEELPGENYSHPENFENPEDKQNIESRVILESLDIAEESTLSTKVEPSGTLLLDSEECLEVARRTLADEELQNIVNPILYPLLPESTEEPICLNKNIMEVIKAELYQEELETIIDIVPSSGKIAPNEYIVLSMAVSPQPNTKMHATITCTVNGGATSELNIEAMCGVMLYSLKSTVIDFGIVPFNDIAETSFQIENIGYAKVLFTLQTGCYQEKFEPEPGWLQIDPIDSEIEPYSNAVVTVRYFPGMPGYFETTASLEVGSYDAVTLTIKGCAVLPQFYFAFPRPLNEEQNVLSYAAIANIAYPNHSRCEEEFTTQFDSDYEDWEFVRYKRHYPSVRDIAMAVERKYIQKHLIENPSLVAFKYANPTAILPDIVFPSYIIDMGYVILNDEKSMLITPMKYPETSASMRMYWLRMARKTVERGFNLVFQKGQPGPYLVFKPTAKIFPVIDTQAVGNISCVVNATIKVDFEIRATVTVPSLYVQSSAIDFGKVRCGYAMRQTVLMKNNGAVPCSYKLLIQSTFERPSNIFFTNSRDGVVDAGQYSQIYIFFQPQAHMKYEWHLIVSIEENLTPMKISLRGYGIFPDLKIIDERMVFEPTLPYSIHNVKKFKIINRSPFPAEICFADFDKDLQEEINITKALLSYYNVTKLFIPPRDVGTPLPEALINIYNSLIDDLKTMIKEKIYKEYIKLIGKYDSSVSITSQVLPEIPDPLEDKLPNEILALFMENLAELRANQHTENMPKKGSIYELECGPRPEEVDTGKSEFKEGVLIIFHGSPLTDFVFAANKTARKLKIEAFSVDQLIYDSLVRNEILAANKVNQMISDTFAEIDTSYKVFMSLDGDIYEVLKNRVELIHSWTEERSKDKELKKPKSATVDDKRSPRKGGKAPSVKATKKFKPIENTNTFLQLPIELFEEMLTESLAKHSTGLVVESLNSIFIKSPKGVLINLLRAAGNMRFIQVVYFSFTFQNYDSRRNQNDSALMQDQETETESGALQNILLMSCDEFERLEGRDLQLFENVYLAQRKQDTERRLLARKARLAIRGEQGSTYTDHIIRTSIAQRPKSQTKSLSSKPSSKSKKSARKKLEDGEDKWGEDAIEPNDRQVYNLLMDAEAEAQELVFILEYWHRRKKQIGDSLTLRASMSASDSKVLMDSKTRQSFSKSYFEGGQSILSAASSFRSRQKSLRDDEIVGEDGGRQTLSNALFSTPSEIKMRAELGVPLWFIANAQATAKVSHSTLVADYLMKDPDCLQALKLAQFASIKEPKRPPQLYSVLSDVQMRSKTSTNIFAIYEPSSPNLSPDKSQTSRHSDDGSSVSKKGTLSRRSSTSLLSLKKAKKSKTKSVKKHTKELVPRRILYTGDEINLEMHFLPDSCGIFTYVYNVEIITLPVPLKIYCEGKADIPRIYMTPSMVFSKLLPQFSGHGLLMGYLEKEEVFHMGAIAVQDERARNECLIVEDKLNFINESYLTCDLSIGFLEKNANFTVGDTRLKIGANNSQFLSVRGHPIQAGTVSNTLVLTCTNNPRVNCIKLSAIGTVLAIDITPHNVIFERVLLNRLVKIDMVLRNQALIGAAWEVNFQDIIEKYGISATSGYIAPLGSNVITFTYEATEYKAVPVEEFDIQFYDKARHCLEPIHRETIKLSAEVVEVGLEYDNTVILGDIKIDQPLTFSYTFKNISQFELKAVFTPIMDNSEEYQDEFAVIRMGTSMEAAKWVIKPNDITKVPIMFMINVPIEFRAAPIYQVTITDPLIDREIMTYTLGVTGKVFSSLYKLCPSDTVKFAAQLLDTEVRVDIILRNVGKYSFNYIVMPVKSDDKSKQTATKKKLDKITSSSSSIHRIKSTKSAKMSKKSRKSTKTSKSMISKKSGKKSGRISSILPKKVKQSVFQQGIFTITPATGVVQPHTEVYIQITCKTKNVGTFRENVLFYISGVTGKYAEGQPLSLEATACVPEIDFTNLENMFKQHFIFQSQDDALCYDQLGSNSMFITQDRVFYFNGTCINLENEARILLKNAGEIGAQVHAAITSDNTAFRIEPETLHIEAYNSSYISIYFKPYLLSKYEAILNISVEQTTSTCEFGLYGEGCMPIIEVISPTLSTSVNTYVLKFNLVRIDVSQEQTIKLRNPGILNAKLILGIVNDPDSTLTMDAVDSMAFKMTNEEGDSAVMSAFTKTSVIMVKSKESVEVNITYTPHNKVKLNAILNIFIINNPYDNTKINITGQGYSEDVVIENLESFIASERAGSVSFEEDSSCTLLAYNLDFGYQHVNQFIKKDIRLSNLSKSDVYKFTFTSSDSNLIFVPSVGHLTPLCSKDIIITYFSSEPVHIQNKVQMCNLSKILYTSDCEIDLAWDERQQAIIYTPDDDDDGTESINKEVQNSLSDLLLTSFIQTKEEPKHEILIDSTGVLQLFLNIIVDYCAYSIEKTELIFPSTQVFESSVEEFSVKNISEVPMYINWSVLISQYPEKSIHRFVPSVSNPRRPQTCFLGKRQLEFYENGRPRTSTQQTSLFSSSFTSEFGSLQTYNDTDPVPISITPAKSVLEPGMTTKYTVKFAPASPFDYHLKLYCDIPNLSPELPAIILNVQASAILPLYHFRIEPSDYLTVRRGMRESCNMSVEEGTKVLEIEAIGLGYSVTKEFSIMNPTGEMFTYRWEKCTKQHDITLFQCESPEGSVMKGRSAKAAFTFISDRVGTFEMFYYFTIEEYKLRVMFLLVGHARQPCVYFSENGISLKPTVLGIDVHHTVKLHNTEDLLISYRVNNASLYHEGRTHKIGIDPLKGILLPKSEKEITINFKPTKIGHFTFNVEFGIERADKPVILTISAICYNIEPTVRAIREYSVTELKIDEENILVVPVLVKTAPEVCTFLIGNVGKVGFFYNWDYADQFLEDYVSLQIMPKEAYVKTDTEIESTITIKAVKPLVKKNIPLILKINYGPAIPITLVCSTCKTRLKFNDLSHDFGACLAQTHNTVSNEWILELTNNDHISYIVRLEPCNYSHLTIIKKETVINPKDTLKVYIYFHPKEIIKYNTKIYFLVNDKRHAITILGEGVSMEVELLNICNKFINFGAVALGKYAKRNVQIVNKTKCPVSIYFELQHRLPIYVETTRSLEMNFEHLETNPSAEDVASISKKEKDEVKKKPAKHINIASNKNPLKVRQSRPSDKSKASKNGVDSNKTSDESVRLPDASGKLSTQAHSIQSDTSLVVDAQEENHRRRINTSIRIRPQKMVKLHPQHSIEYTITYMPCERMPVFQEQLYCQVEDTVIPMCSIKAYCIAPEYHLPKNNISFNTSILGSCSYQYTKLINSGDFGGRFKWSWKATNHEMYKIAPMEGYSSPGTTTNFEVYFEPTTIQCNCTRTAYLNIENYKPTLELVISGTCINLPSPKETLFFSIPVRESQTKTIVLDNLTPDAWIIKPVLNGNYFYVDDDIVVEAKSAQVVQVTYSPLTMTLANKFHQGNVFLPLPDGQGVLYEFIGESQRPQTTAVIEQTIPSKTYNDITLDVYNWLKSTQQFTVVNEVEQNDDLRKVIYKLTGTAIFDVPPCTAKPYKWIIYTLNEGKLNFLVRMLNEATKEYICFEIRLTVVKCEVLDTIVLNTCARQVAEYKLRLENPLSQPTIYRLTTPCSDLFFPKKATLAAYTEMEVLIEYKPLYPTAEFSTHFEAISSTLGTFPFIFKLSANTAEPEGTITIKAHLGLKNEHNAYIYNPTNSNAEFTAKFESTEFSLEKPVVIQPAERGAIEIGFEPSDLGGIHSKLSLTSPTLGIFIFPLHGIGLPPKPQGPIMVKPHASTTIPFKNPFATTMSFQYAVSDANFVLSAEKESLKARTLGKLSVSCNRTGNVDDKFASMATAKLSITCAAEEYVGIEWIFYLQSGGIS